MRRGTWSHFGFRTRLSSRSIRFAEGTVPTVPPGRTN
jgi:hypothetical protein